ncbi:MAG: tetratricopeptide repeat protein [Planctomycetota bacterium]
MSDVAKHRHVEARELCKLLRGDLDWVAMKALEKDRARRYETANELAMDIERHLRDQPVVAGPPGAGYRLRKFVRRNRTGVLFGLTVAAAVLIGLCLAMVGFFEANREKVQTKAALARAEDQRQRAEASFKLAREAVEAMTRAADQQLSRDPAGREGQQLLQKTEDIHGRFLEKRSDEPAAREQAGLAYHRLGRIHEALGEHEEAEQAYRRAIDVFEKLAEDFPETARYQVYIIETVPGWERSLDKLGRRKEPHEIWPALNEKLKGLVRRFPDNSSYRKILVEECNRQDNWPLYEDAIALFEDLLAGHPSCRYELATILMRFGTFLKGRERLEEARQADQKAEAIRKELVTLLPKLARETRRLHMPWPNQGWLCLADYKVRLTQAGEYQLYVRSAGHDNQSNSFYAWIEELADGPGGTVADWYRCNNSSRDADFTAKSWGGGGHFERVMLKIRGGPAVWQIAAPGDYTITFAPREDGVAIDAFVFQLASLPDPERRGDPEESPMTKEKVFLESEGRVVVEAEHFASRTPMVRNWLVVPGEDAGDTAHVNFRGTGYVQALPDRDPTQGKWQILTNKGATQSELGLWEEAIADYSEALAIMPGHLGALNRRAEAYAESGQWDKAIADYSKVIELKPHQWGRWQQRFEAYLQLGQQDKALADYSKAIELDPDNPGRWYARGNAYAHLKQWDKAASDYSKAIELDPDNPGRWQVRGSAYANAGQWDKAIADFSKAIELAPSDSDHWHRRVETYLRMKQGDEAIADSSKAIELAPGDSDRWEIRGRVYMDMERWEEAIADLSKAIELDPNASDNWQWRGETYRRMKQWDNALADHGKAIELDSDNSDRWHKRGWVYFDIEKWEEAIADFSNAIEFDPTRSEFWHWRALAYSNMEKWEEAIADLSKAIKLASTDAEDTDSRRDLRGYYRNLGDVLEKMGRLDQAQEAFQKAKEMEEAPIRE